jgi:KUP system potassium uptake protein
MGMFARRNRGVRPCVRSSTSGRAVADAEVAVSAEPLTVVCGPEGRTEYSSGTARAALALAALGVVYGDIGTSPLYALRECFVGEDALPVSAPNVLGILSIVFWSLTMVASIKYLTFLMQADNEGEGGILALLALVGGNGMRQRRARNALVLLGLFGAALLYGDGVITPAISVLSAVEGLRVATTTFAPFIVPISVALLIVLFLLQRRGTENIGSIFGPTMVVWFATIGTLGLGAIVFQHPKNGSVLSAVNPMYAVHFFGALPAYPEYSLHGWAAPQGAPTFTERAFDTASVTNPATAHRAL